MSLKNTLLTKSYAKLLCISITFVLTVTAVMLGYGHSTFAVEESNQPFSEEEVSFEGNGTTLHGTVLIPTAAGADKKPAVVLLGGSGPEKRDKNHKLATAFAKAGIVAFIYDKRTEGYSAEPTGPRSFSLLADDAAAAVKKIQTLPMVDANNVGLWGVSEGAWVAPLAANRSSEVAFVITMGGIGMAPASQVGWSVGQALDHQGLTSSAMQRALSVHTSRFIVSGEIMGEATYNPIPAIEQLTQPYLAVWGDKDVIQPSFESAQIIADALQRGGNQSHTLRFIKDGNHNGYPTTNGFDRTSDEFIPEYLSLMTTWVGQVTSGHPPVSSADPIPSVTQPAPDATKIAGYDTWELQSLSMLVFIVTFLGYGVVAVWRFIRRKLGHKKATQVAASPVRWYARSAVILGTVVWVYALVYILMTYINSTVDGSGQLGSVVVAGRTGTWLALQLASVAIVLLGLLLAVCSWRRRAQIAKGEKVRLCLVLVGIAVFIPWAAYWQLFTLS